MAHSGTHRHFHGLLLFVNTKIFFFELQHSISHYKRIHYGSHVLTSGDPTIVIGAKEIAAIFGISTSELEDKIAPIVYNGDFAANDCIVAGSISNDKGLQVRALSGSNPYRANTILIRLFQYSISQKVVRITYTANESVGNGMYCGIINYNAGATHFAVAVPTGQRYMTPMPDATNEWRIMQPYSGSNETIYIVFYCFQHSISQTFWSGSEKSVTITIPNLKSRKVLFIETEQTRTFITIPTYDMSSRRFSSLAIHPTNYFSLLGARITVSISGNKLSLEYADYGVYTVSNLGSSPVFAAGDQGRFLAVYG